MHAKLVAIRNRPWFSPVAVGVAFGGLNLLYYFLSPPVSGIDRPFGMGPGGSLAAILAWIEKTLAGSNHLFKGIPPIFRVLVLGVFVGSLVSAIASRELTLVRVRQSRLGYRQFCQAGLGGFLIGFGLLLANGCMVKHLYAGVPGLALSGIATGLAIVAGIWTGSKLIERWL